MVTVVYYENKRIETTPAAHIYSAVPVYFYSLFCGKKRSSVYPSHRWSSFCSGWWKVYWRFASAMCYWIVCFLLFFLLITILWFYLLLILIERQNSHYSVLTTQFSLLISCSLCGSPKIMDIKPPDWLLIYIL